MKITKKARKILFWAIGISLFGACTMHTRMSGRKAYEYAIIESEKEAAKFGYTEEQKKKAEDFYFNWAVGD